VVPILKCLNLECKAVLVHKQSAKEVMRHVISLKEDEQMKVVLLLWHWWLERNQVREGDRTRTADELAF